MSGQTGKKSKKKPKSKTVSLNDFLGDVQAPGMIKQIDWADEADDDFRSVNNSLTYQSTSAPKVIQLPTAPRAARSVEIDHKRIPETGPFTAFVGNLPYEVDENLLQQFFKDLPISNVRLPAENGRFKGFGYVQFADRHSLIKALEMNEETLQKRNIRIDVADNQNKDSGNSYGRSSDRYGGGPDPTESNWRTPATAEELSKRSQYQDRRDSQRNDGYDGGNSYRRPSQGYDRDRYDRGYNDRPGYSSRGYDRPRYDNRGGYDRNRSDDRYGESRRDPEPPRERPQLILKPRQKPLDTDSGTSARSSSIFGSAKPVDTASKEREIEDKLISKQRSVEEPKPAERKSASIFGEAKPIDTASREREIEEKISAKKELIQRAAAAKQAPQPRSSVFGDAKPVDTAARERQIEEKMRRQEHQYSSASGRDDREGGPRSHSRISSERSNDGMTSPRRRSRTSSLRSTDEQLESSTGQKSSDIDPRKPEYKVAPLPRENAWGRKPGASEKTEPIPGKREVVVEKVKKPTAPPVTNAWNRGPPKADRGEREEAEGNSKEDEDEERTPEGAADEESAMQNRNEPGDGSEEGGVQVSRSYASSSRQAPPYKSNRPRDPYPDRQGPARYSGGRNYSNDNRGHDEGSGSNYRENRRRGDGDSYASRSDQGRGFDRNQRDRRDPGARSKTKNELSEKKRDSSRDSRPECDRPDAAGQEQSNTTRPTKSRSKNMQAEKEKPVEIVTKSKFALLAVNDSDDDDEVAMD